MKVNRVPVFENLNQDDKKMLETYSDKIKIGKNKILYREEEQLDFVYYILSGSVKISEHVYIAYAGQFIGFEGVFDGASEYPFEAKTDETAELYRMPRTIFLKLFDDRNLSETINGRNANLLKCLLEQSNTRLLVSASKHQAKKGGSPGAIANLLLYHLDTGDVTLTEHGLQIKMKLSESYIAECCHCDRSTVSRTLTLFIDLDIIYKEKHTRYITIISRERLNDFCLGRIRRNKR